MTHQTTSVLAEAMLRSCLINSQKAFMFRTSQSPCLSSARQCQLAFQTATKSRHVLTKCQTQTDSSPDIRRLAKMAQLAITDQEVAEMEPKINNILKWFDQLQQVDVQGIAPAIHASNEGTALRSDQPLQYDARSALLELAPAKEGSFFRVPKIATAADAVASTGKAAAAAEVQPTSSSQQVSSAAATPSQPDAGSGGPTDSELTALQQLDFRVGRIVSCEKHPEADSLYVEKIDIGEAEPRTIVSGLVKYVPLEEMQDRMVVVIANLKPRNMRGIKSAGMVLAASDDPKTRVIPIAPPKGAAAGERLWFGQRKDQPAPAVPNAVEKKKLWDTVAPGLRTDGQGVVTWKGEPMQASAGSVTADQLPSCRVA